MMEQQTATRKRRTKEELIIALDEKIEAQNHTIKKCEEQKTIAVQELEAKIAAAKAGLSVDEIAERLGMNAEP